MNEFKSIWDELNDLNADQELSVASASDRLNKVDDHLRGLLITAETFLAEGFDEKSIQELRQYCTDTVRELRHIKKELY